MADEKKATGEEKRITLDPSKFTISEDGSVVVTDPGLAEALRAAGDDENAGEHGVGIAVIF